LTAAFLAAGGYRAIVGKNRQRALVIAKDELLSLSFGVNRKIRVARHSALDGTAEKAVINLLAHSHSKPEAAEKCLSCSVKQRVGFKFHIITPLD
jgi:hypothetical protein